jgi:D-amino-acid dehydrogenase
MKAPDRPHVVIIGGGVIGACAAYYLRNEGADVTLLDKGEIGLACSHRNAGYIAPSHFVPLAHPGVITQGLKWMLDPVSPFYIKPRLDPDLLSWVWKFRAHSNERHVRASMIILRDLADLSLKLFEEISRRDGFQFGLEKRGIVMLFNSEKGRRGNLEEVELANEIRVEARLLDKAGLASLDPSIDFRCLGGVHWPGDAHIDPTAFMDGMGEHLKKIGVTIHTGTEVQGFSTENGRIRAVETTSGSVPGDEFVLAGGAWSSTIVKPLGIRLPLQAGKGYSVTVQHPSIKPSLPMILSEARVAITPFAENLRFGGTMELAGLDLSVTERRVDAILKAVPRYLGNVDTAGISRQGAWSGLRPVSPDGLPYIGRFKAYPNLLAATGHAMLGVTLGTGTGKLVAEIISAKTPSLPLGQLNPDRFS